MRRTPITATERYPVRQITDLRDLVEQSARLYGPRVAFRFRDRLDEEPQSRTYEDFLADVRAIGTMILDSGQGGAPIAVIGENSYAWCVAFTAIVCGGGLAVPLDPLLTADELAGLLRRGAVRAIFYDAPYHQLLTEITARLPELSCHVCIRPQNLTAAQIDAAGTGSGRPDVASTTSDGPGISPDVAAPAAERPDIGRFVWQNWQDWLDRGRRLLAEGDRRYADVPIDRYAPMSLLFTSGTSSESKAVLLSHDNICADIRGLAAIIDIPAGTRFLSILPLHHTLENTCGLFMARYIGGETAICDGLRHIQKNLVEYKTQFLIGVPLLYQNFYDKIRRALIKSGKEKLIRRLIPITQALRRVGIDLRHRLYGKILEAFGGELHWGISGAAPIDPDVLRFLDAIGMWIMQGYGLTETSPVVSGAYRRDYPIGSVGKPIAGIEVAVDAEDGTPGEILVRGPIVMLGYHDDPEATAQAFAEDGWLRTGDLGVIDRRKRCLTITGRVKSMIVLSNGKKVFPEEIETLIERTGKVKESLVWSLDDANGDVVVGAKFVIDPQEIEQNIGRPADDTSIRAYLEQLIREVNGMLPSFKNIRHFVFTVDEMVKTTTRKIRRSIEVDVLRDLYLKSQLTWNEWSGRNLQAIIASVSSAKPILHGR